MNSRKLALDLVRRTQAVQERLPGPREAPVTEQEFVRDLRDKVVNGGMRDYQDLFETIAASEAADENWREMLHVYQDMNDDQRRHVLGFVRQIIIDTLSAVFAVMDGKNPLERQDVDEEFVLSIGSDVVSGDLQDTLLTMEEDG
jgi:uncharacterized Zn finger protein